MDRVTADLLVEAHCVGRPVAADRLSVETIPEAYRIQRLLVNALVQGGRTIGGWKLGMTNRDRQLAFGLTEPTRGTLFADAIARVGDTIAYAPTIGPRIEPEIALLIDADLVGPGVSAIDIAAATRVAPAFELLDSRVGGWPPSLTNGLADNAAGLGAIIGEPVPPDRSAPVTEWELTFERDQKLVGVANVCDTVGEPARTVAWLANELSREGLALRRGEVVLSGGVLAPQPLTEGFYQTTISGGLGAVAACVKHGANRCELHISVT